MTCPCYWDKEIRSQAYLHKCMYIHKEWEADLLHIWEVSGYILDAEVCYIR